MRLSPLLLNFLLLAGCKNTITFYTEIETGGEKNHDMAAPLQQPFTYLAEGAQMYAFESADKAYVLKLFKAHHTPSFKLSRSVQRFFRSKAEREASHSRWKGKFKDTCRRYEMAFIHLKEETGLLFLHFKQTQTPLPVTVKHRGSHQIDLSKLPFILQKKATLAPLYFKKHPDKRNEAIQALKAFFAKRIAKGFNDPRQSLSINYGFIEDTPIQLDVGKIEPFEGDTEAALEKIYAHIEEWSSRI